MSEVSQNSSAPMQASDRVFKALKEARAKLEAIEQARNERIAIVGMAGRFPGADNLEEFWNLLEQGKSGIRTLSEEELRAAGVPESTFQDPNYVRAYASFSDPTGFDAGFFGYSPREAELIDPQHRVFLECAWSALEDAGYDGQQYDGTIGVYGGAALNSYVVNLHSDPNLRESISPVQAVVSNVMGLMPTRVSYQLDLTGPSCGIQTGCSTALVAIHTACQSLLNHECDMALAGGVTVSSATPQGYMYQAESIASPDGVCRAFDANGQGTLFGNGVGIVVLKRLQAALAGGDHIYAVIAGSAINNDGADKVNLIAPSVSGQAAVIRAAIEQAGINPNTISYVEGHGTGTPLGDPIEVAALNKAFGNASAGKESSLTTTCALGSVKTNVGHLDAAAGAAGVIKTVLALQHKKIPASLNYTQPNPKIDFQNGPFVVNQHCVDWPSVDWSSYSEEKEFPRRAGVSSFGMGGTNAHAILEEAPQPCQSGNARPWQLLTLSAKTSSALETTVQNLSKHLQQHPDLDLADVAYTLQVGRRDWTHRRYFLCQTTEDAINQLNKRDSTDSFKSSSPTQPKSVVFMFSGQGAQYVDMARELYETEPVFQKTVDQCAEILTEESIDLFEILYPKRQKTQSTQQPGNINQTAYSQPALFVVEYALAQLWSSWGIQPQAMIGHSIGEYVAACVAGVFSLSEAITLIVKRGQLMQRCAPGSMLSVLAAEETLKPLLTADVELAVINSPHNCVLSGPTPAIESIQQQLSERDIPCRLLTTSHAFHSVMMEGALAEFAEALETVTLSPPTIDLISNVSGTWLEDTEATDPDYWVRQLRSPVQFSSGITEILKLPHPVLLEVGPGHTLTKLARQNSDGQLSVIQSLPHPQDSKSDTHTLTNAVGQLWLSGVSLQWKRFHESMKRHRLSLPTYPFERESYWIPLQENGKGADNRNSPTNSKSQEKVADMADWFYLPTWKRLPLTAQGTTSEDERWLIFANSSVQTQLKTYLSTLESSPTIIWVNPDSEFSDKQNGYTLRPSIADDYKQLAQSLVSKDTWPAQIVYAWGMTNGSAKKQTSIEQVDDFQSLLYLTQAISSRMSETGIDPNSSNKITLSTLTTGIYDIASSDSLNPHKAKALGFSQVIAQEVPGVACRLIDVEVALNAVESGLIQQLYRELLAP